MWLMPCCFLSAQVIADVALCELDYKSSEQCFYFLNFVVAVISFYHLFM
jgi:hypothetical protein